MWPMPSAPRTLRREVGKRTGVALALFETRQGRRLKTATAYELSALSRDHAAHRSPKPPDFVPKTKVDAPCAIAIGTSHGDLQIHPQAHRREMLAISPGSPRFTRPFPQHPSVVNLHAPARFPREWLT